MVLLLVNIGNYYRCCSCTSLLQIWKWRKSCGFSLPCLILVQSLYHVHKQKKSVASTSVLLDFCDWMTVPLFVTGEVLLDLKGNRFSVDLCIFFKLFYFKPALFLEGWQIDPVLCKPYAVMPKQFLPNGTNSRFSHNCHNWWRTGGWGVSWLSGKLWGFI